MSTSRALLLCIALLALLSACSSPSAMSECNDGIDNDGDERIDGDDPGCQLHGDRESPDIDCTPESTEPECTNEPVPACSDEVDNDGDGLTDFPDDPGCTLRLQDAEEDDCPEGDKCPACGNEVDDDADGDIDYPEDLGCSSASDGDEFNANPEICGATVSIQPLPADNTAAGQIVNDADSALSSISCGGVGQEVVYVMTVTEPVAISASTDFADTNMDTVLYVRSDCSDQQTELACNDDAAAGNLASTLFVDRLDPGTYNLIVDTATTTTVGPYRLGVEVFVPQGEPCTEGDVPCAPGFFCRLLNGAATTETCELPECSDGLDNVDGEDTLADFPNDPGCSSPEDNDESDSCPAGPGCPQCSNNQDDDGDGLTDFDGNGGSPDLGCQSAADNLEINDCIAGVPLLELSDAGTNGTTEASGNSDFRPSCHTSTLSSEDEYAYFNSRNLTSLSFSTVGSVGDTVLYVRHGSCGLLADEVACLNTQNGGEEVTIASPVQNDYYYVFVDGDFVSAISYVLNVSGTLAAGAACSVADTQFVCDAALGLSCVSSTCQ